MKLIPNSLANISTSSLKFSQVVYMCLMMTVIAIPSLKLAMWPLTKNMSIGNRIGKLVKKDILLK